MAIDKTTEIAILPLEPGSRFDPIDPTDPGGKAVQEMFKTLWSVDGLASTNYGPVLEDPDSIQLLIGWTSREHHKRFEASPKYGPFVESIGKVMTGPVQSMIHVDFEPHEQWVRARNAPVTEFATFYFDGEPPADYGAGVQKAAEWLAKETKEFQGLAWGTTYETVERDGVKGRAAVVAIGWSSKEAHMDFRSDPSFKENIHLLRSSSKAIEMHHTKVRSFVDDE